MPKTLLLADDSVVIQKLVGLSFANENVEIVATDNGDDAIAKAREVSPDVVLADVVMPGKSGYEVCEAIKQDPALAHVPVLLLTGTFEAFDESRAESAGADGQITKPFEAQALVERVTEFMNRPRPEPSSQPPATEIIEADAQPIPATATEPASDLQADVSVAEDDFFDANMTTLSPLEASPLADAAPSSPAGEPLTTDSTPAFEGDASTSTLFGSPREGASADLDIEIGGLSLGQSVAGDEAASLPDATVAMLDEPPLLPPRAEEPPRDEVEDFGLDAPFSLPPVTSTAGLDSALDAGPEEGEATILVARDDVNAKTSPDLESELESAPEAEPAAPGALEALTVHAPTGPIDTNAAESSGPLAQSAPLADATVVADLDASLDVAPSTPGVSATDSAPSVPPVPDDASLDLGPSSVASDDLDFGFDVSEQAPPELYGDSPEDSFSSLMDISNSTLLGDSAPQMGADAPDEGAPPTASPENGNDDILVGFDVSSSDLATAPPAPASPSSVEIFDAIPASAPQTPFASAPLDREPPAPSISSPSELPPQHAAEPEAPDPTPAESTDWAEPEEASGDESILAAAAELAVGVFESPAPGFETGADDASAEEEIAEDPVAAEEVPPRVDLLETEPVDSPRVSDLSPLMEQRIQETLEKVAWEAFSDLSESIVKQVMGRVERIAWEVIPQMAETLVREEIRKMKGEDD